MDIALPKNQRSLWMPKTQTRYPVLQGNLEVDVVIIGGGIAGVSVGYKLKQLGYRVAIVEKNAIASGTTAGTTGKVSVQHGLIYSRLIKKFGRKNAQLYAKVYTQALADIQSVIQSNKIACDWSDEDHYIYTNSVSTLKTLQAEARDAASLGMPTTFVDQPLDTLPFSTKGYLVTKKQARFNAYLYTLGLADVIHGNGSYVFENSEVIRIQQGKPANIVTSKGRVTARYVVVATKVPPAPLVAHFSYAAIIYPENSHLVASEVNLKLGGMYNSPDQKHYSLLPVQQGNKNYLLIGGENHIPGLGFPNKHYQRLANYGRQWFNLRNIQFKWRAMDYIAYDKLPVIGRLYPDSTNMFIVSGFKKWGLATSMVAAKIIPDLLAGKPSPAGELFYPHRPSAPTSMPRAALDYLRQ